METNWEKEKAYAQKRAEELRKTMEEAIRTCDKKVFNEAYQQSQRYMSKSARMDYMGRFLNAMRMNMR